MNLSGSISKLADQFAESLPCHAQKPYPSAHIPVKNKRAAELLLSAYADGGNAELTAIAQYIHHSKTISNQEISDVVFCIALVEMHHLDMIGTMIDSLGGDPKYMRPNGYYWSGGNVDYGQTICEKLSLDILSEQAALDGYAELLRAISLEGNPQLQQVEAVIRRIMEDEKFHLDIFTDLFERYCRR